MELGGTSVLVGIMLGGTCVLVGVMLGGTGVVVWIEDEIVAIFCDEQAEMIIRKNRKTIDK